MKLAKLNTLLLGASLMGATHAAEVFTSSVGYNVVNCLGGSDTHVSVPFHQKPIYEGVVTDFSFNAGTGEGTFTLSSSISVPQVTNVNDAAGDGLYYFRATSGSDAGKYYNITAVGGTTTGAGAGTTITVDMNGDDTASTSFNTEINSGSGLTIGAKLIQHWTLDTLFPPLEQEATDSTIHLSTNNISFFHGSTVLMPNRSGLTINKASASIHFVKSVANGGWTQDAAGFPSSGSTIIDPDSGLIVRHKVGAANTSYVPKGVVCTANNQILLQTSTTGQVDNPISLERPVPIELQNLNTELTGSVFVESINDLNVGVFRGDEIHVFDNVLASLNKSAAKIYYRKSTGWHRDTAGFPSADTDEISPSEYIVIRKKATVDGAPVYWNNAFSSIQD